MCLEEAEGRSREMHRKAVSVFAKDKQRPAFTKRWASDHLVQNHGENLSQMPILGPQPALTGAEAVAMGP